MELKHISPYLPYGVKAIDEHGKTRIVDWECQSYTNTIVGLNHVIHSQSVQVNCFKILLRPLSDLTKEIEHNGKRFVPGNKIDSIITDVIDDFVYVKYDGTTHVLDLSYKTIQQLLEWEFDIFNLIEKAEAIDANTLETNPYK